MRDSDINVNSTLPIRKHWVCVCVGREDISAKMENCFKWSISPQWHIVIYIEMNAWLFGYVGCKRFKKLFHLYFNRSHLNVRILQYSIHLCSYACYSLYNLTSNSIQNENLFFCLISVWWKFVLIRNKMAILANSREKSQFLEVFRKYSIPLGHTDFFGKRIHLSAKKNEFIGFTVVRWSIS